MAELDEPTPDVQPTYSDFYEAFRRKTPSEKAALVWRMPKNSPIVIFQKENCSTVLN